MTDLSLLRRVFLRSPLFAATSGDARASISALDKWLSHYGSIATAIDDDTEDKNEKKRRGWFTLPPFSPTVDGATLGKELSGRRSEMNSGDVTAVTALKWVLRCCPQLPRSLVQKLFRLRQVRRQSCKIVSSDPSVQEEKCRLRRVAAKDSMNFGDQIFLPISVQTPHSGKAGCFCNEEEMKFLHSLELYKDPAIIVVNKPPGMPVQGGIGIKRSLDELASTYLRYDYSEPPRLVHRLDRDSSGILVMGRTQLSAAVLHSVFREKTFDATVDDLENKRRTLHRRYWALVIGSPRRPQGFISVPLRKVVMDNGKSEQITVIDDVQTMSTQHAITEYQVIKSSSHGFTWLELSPLTGRKHQLRVHCAEVLGTPIVGDYKYGWQAHRKWKQFPCTNLSMDQRFPKGGNIFPFGIHLENGSISEKQPRLHLHCKEMVLPDVSLALQNAQISSDCDPLELESLKFVAPLPYHMQKSWDILKSGA